ncbi:MAG: DUF2958 domain-containing protein [Pyrinomonadaceae bacterium]
MSKLLTETLKNALPAFRTQEFEKDPLVYAVFFFPGSGWTWFVTEGQPEGDDFVFFGYVIGFESEWGYFTLRELEEVDIHGMKIEKINDFVPTPISDLKKQAVGSEV